MPVIMWQLMTCHCAAAGFFHTAGSHAINATTCHCRPAISLTAPDPPNLPQRSCHAGYVQTHLWRKESKAILTANNWEGNYTGTRRRRARSCSACSEPVAGCSTQQVATRGVAHGRDDYVCVYVTEYGLHDKNFPVAWNEIEFLDVQRCGRPCRLRIRVPSP